MQKSRVTVLAALAASLVCACSAQAFTTNGIPYAESFEGISSGFGMYDYDSWYASTDDVVYVTNETYSYSGSYPLNSADHTNILYFDGTVSNFVESTADTAIWTDILLAPGRLEDTNLLNSVSDDAQLAFYFNTNGYFVLYHRAATDPGNTGEKKWSEFTGTEVDSNEWVRISINHRYDVLDFNHGAYYFQVKVNGQLLSHADGFASLSGFMPDSPDGGSYFPFALASPISKMQSFTATGIGRLDDVKISTDTPVFLPVVFASKIGHGTITPSGTLILPSGQTETNFDISADAGYYILSVKTNDVDLDGVVFDTSTTNYNFAWNNLLEGSYNSVVAHFRLPQTTNGVPYSYLDDEGLTGGGTNYQDAADADQDGDGHFTWQEWLTGTDPNDSNSVLRIAQILSIGGTNYFTWPSSANGAGMPYLLMRSAAGADAGGVWEIVSPNVTRTPPTNEWWDLDMTNTMFFYKVGATNDPDILQ